MIIPVRCFTCGKIIANRWDLYIRKKNEYSQEDTDSNINIEMINSGNYIETPESKALQDCKINRICCRRMFLSHCEMYSDI